jgi:nicotinamidase-related amidase
VSKVLISPAAYLKKIQHIVTIVKRGQRGEVNVMKKEALLVIDMLNDFVLPGASLEVPDTRTIIPVIQKEIGRARAAGNPVIYVCDSHAPDDKEFRKFGWPAHAVKGTAGAEVVEELKPAPGDSVITKDTYSGFYGTRLDETLKNLGADSLRLTGCVTHICIMFTASDAVLRDYEVTVVEDGVAGLAREDHDAAFRIMKNVMGVEIVKSGTEVSGRKAA